MRKRRLLRANAFYHVTARVNRKEFIFKDDNVKELFLDILKRAKKKYKFTITTFCIMSNHVHINIKPGKKESLSKIMQWILSVFAIYFNKIYGVCGHVWYDRFTSKIIENIKQMLDTNNYINLNPVNAGMIFYAEDYKYSGLYHLIKGNFSIIDKPPIE